MKKIGVILIISTLLSAFPAFSFLQDNPAQDADTTKTKEKKKDLPLESGRNFEFDLSEGSWISLDISSDGKLIVFDFLGDLYTIPIAGGDATQITNGFPFDSQPSFSPDSRKVVYISQTNQVVKMSGFTI